MKRNCAIAALAMLALLSACKNPSGPQPASYTIKINMSGNVQGDSVTVSSASGQAGNEITLNYTVANDKLYNWLVFSGTKTAIAQVDGAGPGTRKYTINSEDAAKGVITINAVFTHSDDAQPGSYTITVNMSGNVSGDSVTALPASGQAGTEITLSYTVANTKLHNRLVFSGTKTAIAQADGEGSGTRKYTINSEDAAKGVITINAVFTHSDDAQPGSYTITVNMSGNVSGDSVTASPASGQAGTEITLSYTVANTKLHNRLVFSGTKTAIAQADSAGSGTKQYAINTEDAAENVITINAVFLHSDKQFDTIAFADGGNVTKTYGDPPFTKAVTNNGSGTGAISYVSSNPAVATVNISTGEVTICFIGTTVITATKASDEHYEEAKAVYTLTVMPKTLEVSRTTIVDFEADAIGKTYESTKGGSAPTVKVVTDPLNSGQKSLQITSSDYNQAAIVPVNLPVELKNYKSFSFRFNLLSSADLTGQSIMVYAANNAADFKQYGFGNPADSSYAQFADKLLGSTPSETIGNNHRNKWTTYTLTISNPGPAIRDLKGDIYIAIGINVQNGANYMIDDLKFEMKDDYNPPPIVILPPPNPPTIGAVVSGNYRNMFAEWGKSDAEITAKVNATWNKLFNGSETEKVYYTVGSDMAYILDSGNNDVRSEGMSYGMMMCVQLDKKTEFDRLWKWAKTNMYNAVNNGKNSRGYFAWQCGTDGSKKDVNPAPDGEFYFVTALLFASARWGDGTGDFNYGKWARQVLYDMLHRTAPPDPYGEPPMFNKSNNMVYFTPYGGGLHTDPSYHLPAFYEVWALELENDWKNNKLYDTANTWKTLAELKTDIDFYKQAVQASRAFFPKTTNATTGLGPDYANFDGTATGGEHADFKYDAWRIAMNIAVDYAWWAADPWQKTFADRIQAFFYSKGVSSYGSLWTLNGTLLSASSAGDHSPGLVACNAVASLAASHENAWKFLENFWEMPMTSGQYRYYDGCLYMLGLLHVSGNFKAYLSSNAAPVPGPVISPTSATFDKKTEAQADIPVTMTLNGYSFVSVKNGGTTLGSGTDYSINGNTVTLKKSYLAAQANGTTTLTFTFNDGKSRDIAISITDTTGGGGGGGTLTKYDFANSSTTITAGYPKYSGTGIEAKITGGVLEVKKTNSSSTESFVISFNVGVGGNISNYSDIKLNIRGVSGDYTYKNFIVWAGITTGTQLGSQSTSLTTSFTDITVPLSGSLAADSSGIIEIGFGFPNANAYIYEIKSIELISK
jgi:endo-1,4-beta-D-glucanase Y